MATIPFTPALSQEYEKLFNTMTIRPEKMALVDQAVAGILQNKSRYQKVEQALRVPWYFVGAIHSMESSRNFTCHLHNGDPLNARTVQVPKGRPLGNPPFTWEVSAEDALTLKGLDKITDWSLGQLLYQMERYNGFGYRQYHSQVQTPYLWSCSNHYSKGKYVADGHWSDSAVSQQIGAAVLLHRLQEKGAIPALFTPILQSERPLFKYSNNVEPRAADLQRFLNTFNGNNLVTDGKPGKNTSDAVKKLFGFKLDGAPE